MRNRWFHPATLHTQEAGEKRANWLELFYDLIFVASFILLGNGLSKHVTIEGFLKFAFVFLPLWFTWTGFTFYNNRFTVDDFLHRIFVFIQMFAVGSMAISAPHILDGHHRGFSVAAAVALFMVAVMLLRAWKQVPEARGWSGFWGIMFVANAGFWLLAALTPTPYAYFFWGAAILLFLGAPFHRQAFALSEQFPNDEEHLSERYGLLTIIVLGESFVKVLSNLAQGEMLTSTLMLRGGLLLLLTCCLWWIYFDDVAGSRVRRGRFNDIIWVLAHIPLQIAVTAAGVAIYKAVNFELGVPVKESYRWLLAGTLGLAMLSVAVIDSVTARRQAELSDRARVTVRFGSAFLLLLLAPAGASMNASMFIALVTAVCVAQVIFDMMMAPLEAMPEVHHAPATASPPANPLAADKNTSRRQFNQAVRKGTPNEFRQDIYFWFMDGSWTRFFAAVLFMYVISNVFFAALYVLHPGCIGGGQASNFAEAFYFSIQTMSTIGFGVLHPVTDYGNVIVTIEAAFGLLGVAMVTGLMMAKASRPTSKVLFSENLLLMQWHGLPQLVFRAGNARGNEVADAAVTVTAVIDEVSPEGHHINRLHDLKLTRNRSPMFSLTWTVSHPLDSESPLLGPDLDENSSLEAVAEALKSDQLKVLMVTLLGHDVTYGQTVHARHMYWSEDIRVGHRFVNIGSELPDGRFLVDYSRFHETEPVENPPIP